MDSAIKQVRLSSHQTFFYGLTGLYYHLIYWLIGRNFCYKDDGGRPADGFTCSDWVAGGTPPDQCSGYPFFFSATCVCTLLLCFFHHSFLNFLDFLIPSRRFRSYSPYNTSAHLPAHTAPDSKPHHTSSHPLCSHTAPDS